MKDSRRKRPSLGRPGRSSSPLQLRSQPPASPWAPCEHGLVCEQYTCWIRSSAISPARVWSGASSSLGGPMASTPVIPGPSPLQHASTPDAIGPGGARPTRRGHTASQRAARARRFSCFFLRAARLRAVFRRFFTGMVATSNWWGEGPRCSGYSTDDASSGPARPGPVISHDVERSQARRVSGKLAIRPVASRISFSSRDSAFRRA